MKHSVGFSKYTLQLVILAGCVMIGISQSSAGVTLGFDNLVDGSTTYAEDGYLFSTFSPSWTSFQKKSWGNPGPATGVNPIGGGVKIESIGIYPSIPWPKLAPS